MKHSSLQIPDCSFPVIGAIQDREMVKYVRRRGGGGQTSGHQDSWQEGGRSWRLLVGLLEELLAGGQE